VALIDTHISYDNSSSFSRKNPTPSPDPTIVSSGSTLVALIRAYGGPFWFSAILRLFCDALLISTPLLLGLLINYIYDGGAAWKGFFLISILFIVSFLQPYLNGQYFHNNLNTGYRIRAGLMAAVYRKALKIASSVKKNTTVGEVRGPCCSNNSLLIVSRHSDRQLDGRRCEQVF
jgi:ABC-type bacteriocin/lantibiotic exporter with double-glycine peptidase domain